MGVAAVSLPDALWPLLQAFMAWDAGCAWPPPGEPHDGVDTIGAQAPMPELGMRAVMPAHGTARVDAAIGAGHTDYANWLIAAFGQGQLPLLSER